MNIFERQVGGRRYRIASQALWDPAKQRPLARQAVLGSADPAPVADLAATCTVGTRLVGDIGALVWVAEQLDLIRLIDQACGLKAPRGGPRVGEMVLAVAVQRACAPAAKCHLAAFLDSCVPRLLCLPGSAFTGQSFHRLAAQVTDKHLEKAQNEIARSVIRRFELSTDVLAFDPTYFDTFIATTSPGSWRAAATPRASERICGWSDWRLWSVRRDMCRCCTAPTPATGPTRRCSVNAWMPWGNYTMLWMTGIGAPDPVAVRWCATAVRGVNNWNWIWTPPATTR